MGTRGRCRFVRWRSRSPVSAARVRERPGASASPAEEPASSRQKVFKSDGIGVKPGQIDSSRVALMAGLLCGESRSGPDPSKLGWRGSARTAAPPGDVARGAGPKPDPRSPGHDGASSPIVSGQRSAGVAGDPRLCSWIAWIAEVVGGARQSIAQAGTLGFVGDGRRSGSVKRVAFDEAAGGGDPGVSSRGGESNPVNPREGARQRASEVGARPSLPAEEAGGRGRCSEGS